MDGCRRVAAAGRAGPQTKGEEGRALTGRAHGQREQAGGKQPMPGEPDGPEWLRRERFWASFLFSFILKFLITFPFVFLFGIQIQTCSKFKFK
jgi:hypothetical protein